MSANIRIFAIINVLFALFIPMFIDTHSLSHTQTLHFNTSFSFSICHWVLSIHSSSIKFLNFNQKMMCFFFVIEFFVRFISSESLESNFVDREKGKKKNWKDSQRISLKLKSLVFCVMCLSMNCYEWMKLTVILDNRSHIYCVSLGLYK